MLFLIVAMMFSGLFVLFDCYDAGSALYVVFFIVTTMIKALCVVFDFYDSNYRALCKF